MTAQIPDEVRYQDDEFTLAGVNGDGLPTPEEFGIFTHSRSTACWRGFVMKYEYIKGQLLLQEMMVNTENPPEIKGIKPKSTHGKSHQFEYIYENLRYTPQFTGTMLIAKDFIREMYIHMGFQSPWAYQTVIELALENGHIIQEENISKQMEALRQKYADRDTFPDPPSEDDLKQWIEKRFSLTYPPTKR